MDQRQQYNAAGQPMYQQPAAPANMQYQSNPSNQQLNEKHNHNHGFGSKWTFSFWDCFSPVDTCCLGCWCPCILYGKTQARNEGDPHASGLGLMCCAYYCLLHIGGHSILQAVTRHSMRNRLGIEGDGCTDWIGACCCPCCGLVQEEKESLLRETGIDPKTKQQYQAPGPMMG